MCKYQMINWDLIFDEDGEHLENIYDLTLSVIPPTGTLFQKSGKKALS